MNQVAVQLDIPPVISNISSRTYGNYISLIRQYLKTSFSKKTHYKELGNSPRHPEAKRGIS
ncbi:MAG: hypothetical protein A3E88_05175 [Legionellales bacterium RIFCSPHIGHO2_12_FULL_35_11]|nr:MAG: hypothetical protein A3E88_05175 [Legionellales bacterium RIFCSPHIGHO2_12_FULL_35_11]